MSRWRKSCSSAGSAWSSTRWRPREPAARVCAGLGGLALGLTILVRIDGISDILPVVPYAGLLLIRRRPQAVPLVCGLSLGALAGLADGVLLARPYLAHNKGSVLPLVALAGLVTIVTAGAIPLLRRRRLPAPDWSGRRGRWWLGAAAILPFAVLVGLAVRPYVHRVPVVPGLRPSHRAITYHHYLQYSLHWVFWYLGVPAVLLAALGAAVLARRCLRGEMPAWALPLITFSWIIVTVLYRPAIVPHQPWASRRLVPGVLPGLILLAVWGTGWLISWARRQDYGPVATAAVPLLAAALVLPAAMTTFGLGVRDGGPLGIRPVADGWAVRPTEAGEITAVHRMCAALPRKASVVMVDGRVSGQFTEVVRGMCGYPAAILRGPHPGHRATGRAPRRGGRPATGAPGYAPRKAGPLRDRDPAHHAAAHDPGSGDHDAPARGCQSAGLRRLDAGGGPVTAPRPAPGRGHNRSGRRRVPGPRPGGTGCPSFC